LASSRHGQRIVKRGFRAYFIGDIIDGRFNSIVRPDETQGDETKDRYLETRYPPLGEETFEWIALLSAVLDAQDHFIMIEAGSGFGRWLIRAVCALRQKRPRIPFTLVGIEAEPTHFAWMAEHFRNNGVDPEQHRLIHAAIGADSQIAELLVNDDPSSWYGQTLRTTHDGRYASGYRSISVPSISLNTLLSEYDQVDLLDMDIQGAEEQAVQDGIDAVTAKVGRVFIGTHAPHIDTLLNELFASRGWRCVHRYPCLTTSMTEFGEVEFQDGVQHWVNPALNSRVR